MTVRELLDRVDSRELSEWRAFYSLEPFGSEADLFGHAMNAAHVINSQRPKNKQVKVEDLMPKRKKPQGVEQMIAYAAAMTVAMGGEDKRGEK